MIYCTHPALRRYFFVAIHFGLKPFDFYYDHSLFIIIAARPN
ncbi:MAG: hypothetical protein NZ580_03970 [Bacteroidia bacterium]|nr:hypothetical protein [Bacteroidia bacterium]